MSRPLGLESQRLQVVAAGRAASDTLMRLAVAARAAARTADRGKPVDYTHLRGLVQAVWVCEEALDWALADLTTAAGGDL